MGKFRRKPIVFEAVQWFKAGDHPAVDYGGKDDAGHEYYSIKTLEGRHAVTPGDWIVTGVKGEVWPVKPDIFAATYDPVTE